MSTVTGWDPAEHPRGEGQRFISKPQAPSTAAFPSASGFLRHDEAEGTFAFPPKRFTDVDEAVDYWSRVPVPEEVLFDLQVDQKVYRKDVGREVYAEIQERHRSAAMADAVRSFPEPDRRKISPLDRKEALDARQPSWYASWSKSTVKARDEMVAERMKAAEPAIQQEWENHPGLPEIVHPADARTVARVVRMSELFEGDHAALREVPVEWRGEPTTVGALEKRLAGFTQFKSARMVKSSTDKIVDATFLSR